VPVLAGIGESGPRAVLNFPPLFTHYNFPVNKNAPQIQLKRDIRRLFRSMDFVSRHPALKRDSARAARYAEIYQQLGLAWEFLGLQCKHREGWRKTREGKSVCKVCGLIRGVKEQWVLVSRDGRRKRQVR
jgi:hypothetical protein